MVLSAFFLCEGHAFTELFAIARNLGVGGQNLKPPHLVVVGVGEVEPADYVRTCLDLCRFNIALSQPLVFAGEASDFEQDRPTGGFHFTLYDLHPGTTYVEFNISWKGFQVGHFSKESRVPCLRPSKVAYMDLIDSFPGVYWSLHLKDIQLPIPRVNALTNRL